MSDSDIQRGAQWASTLTTALEDARFGVVCITPENMQAPWLMFEAGALAKAVAEETFVSPYLLNVTPTQLQGPLSLFQATRANKDDTRKLLESINRRLGDQARTERDLDELYQALWPRLEQEITDAGAMPGETVSPRTTDDILSEILELSRQTARHGARFESAAGMIESQFLRWAIASPGEKTAEQFLDYLSADDQIRLLEEGLASIGTGEDQSSSSALQYMLGIAKLRKEYEERQRRVWLPPTDLLPPQWKPLFGP
jgi:hypothetical protein